jgi:hypothetical protein
LSALGNSPITDAVGAWCVELGLPTLGPSRLAGHNRARRLRLVRSTLADLLGVDLQVIRSRRGHDSFLVEIDQINAVLADALT